MTPRLRMGTRVRLTKDLWADGADEPYDECHALDPVAAAGDEGVVVNATGTAVLAYRIKLDEDGSLQWVHESLIEPV